MLNISDIYSILISKNPTRILLLKTNGVSLIQRMISMQPKIIIYISKEQRRISKPQNPFSIVIVLSLISEVISVNNELKLNPRTYSFN